MNTEVLKLHEQLRIQRFRKRLVRGLCTLGAVVLAGYAISPFYTVGFNITHSLPGYVYLIEKDVAPVKDGVFAFHPPKNPYQNTHYFVKLIKGVPGDVVTWQGQDFFINGIPLGTAKPVSIDGKPLTKSGAGVIPQGYYFVWTPHKDSFDSRYGEIGWIHESAFIGRAQFIF